MELEGARSATSREAGAGEGHFEDAKKGGEEMKRLILAVVVAIVIVLTAKYFGLLSGPVILRGQVIGI